MLSDSEQAYLELPADARLEIRLPALLKQHAEMVASARHEKVSEFVLSVVAEAVAEGLAEAGTWKLTMPEQAELLQILSRPATHTPAMTAARTRAENLFGPGALD
jgi:uncharacterized protein (DUF1778 family)